MREGAALDIGVMRGRGLLGRILLGCLVLGGTATELAAQQQAKRIGLLIAGPAASRVHLEQSLVESLRAEGYVEGRNLVIERRYAEGGGPARLREQARELRALKLDAVVTTCTPSTRAMKEQTSTLPIVMAVVADPVGQGLIASLARPGSNVTGTSSQAEDVVPKMVEFFAEVLPKHTPMAVLADRRNAVHPRLWEQARKAATTLGLQPSRYEIGHSGEIEGRIADAVREGARALLVLPDHPIFLDHRARIVAAALGHRLPTFFGAREFVEAGGLMSFGEDIGRGWYRAGGYVRRVVQGANPAELPVAQPTTFELVISRRAAQSLGIAIPQSLLLRADRVIE
jgi:putative tryptophan/tyrosine transport system substrate-binding protein